jgi:hypothetical protein
MSHRTLFKKKNKNQARGILSKQLGAHASLVLFKGQAHELAFRLAISSACICKPFPFSFFFYPQIF